MHALLADFVSYVLYIGSTLFLHPSLFSFSSENTVFVRAFVRTKTECMRSCSKDDSCGYYKYFAESDDKMPLMCYHLKSCSPRIIAKEECPLEVNNYIDHMLFTRSEKDCLTK